MKNLRDHGFLTNNITYVIAEIGINHGGSLETAKNLIQSASKTGCDAVKFQTYITEKRAPEGNQEVYDILKKCELPFAAFEELKRLSNDLELDFFSTPFDDESVDCLESLNVDLYKVASFDVVNKTLLKKIASTRKPIIMSVGMANLAEIQSAYELITANSKNLAILHCISAYPTEEKDANLSAISFLKSSFPDCVIGQSDHTQGIKVPLYAVALGAQIIEKHFKIDENMECVDGPVSISEDAMKDLVREIRFLEGILGEEDLKITDIQEPATIFRRPSN